MSFRNHRTLLTAPPHGFSLPNLPRHRSALRTDDWEAYLRRTINMYYRAAAVESVQLGAKRENLRKWTVHLFAGIDPAWLTPASRKTAQAHLRSQGEGRLRGGFEGDSGG